MTKLKIAGSASLVAAITAPLLIQQNALTRLREENRQLPIKSQHSSGENNTVTSLPEAVGPAEGERLRAEHIELMRLWGEVGVRGRQMEELKAKLDV